MLALGAYPTGTTCAVGARPERRCPPLPLLPSEHNCDRHRRRALQFRARRHSRATLPRAAVRHEDRTARGGVVGDGEWGENETGRAAAKLLATRCREVTSLVHPEA